VKRILISLIAICVMSGFAAAQTTGKPVILYGCYYPGPNPDICQYFVYSGLPSAYATFRAAKYRVGSLT
jgi:hypothetical protein